MELKEYLKVFKKYFAFILLVSLTGALIAYISTKSLQSGFTLARTFYLAPPEVNPALSESTLQTLPDYTYEGFYAQEKARNFTDTAVAILESKDFQQDVAEGSQSLSVRKVAPQVIRLTTVAKNPESAQKLMDKTVYAFNGKFTALSGSSYTLSLKPISQNVSAPTLNRIDKKVVTVAGIILGFAFAIFVISLKTYFKI